MIRVRTKRNRPDGDASAARGWVRCRQINLFLRRRQASDGYHALQSLVVFAETSDRMDFARPDLTLKMTGPFGKALARISTIWC